MKFLITGAKGQLAREFLNQISDTRCQISNIELIALDKDSLDISDPKAVSEAVAHFKPDVIINCAAYNFVDKAEGDFDTAFRVNALGPKNLASICKKYNALLIHYSTDYVFDGVKVGFYTEEDEPKPINNYGKSKLDGEKFYNRKQIIFIVQSELGVWRRAAEFLLQTERLDKDPGCC
jgi:dTDP-4-dehydrorhamnose reductase